MTTKILIKRIENLERQVKVLQRPKKLKPVLRGVRITDAMLEESKKMWSKSPKFITKQDILKWK